jgi:hypothetical protein
MKHEQPDHFDRSDIREVVAKARPDQILRLLQDIGIRMPVAGATKTGVTDGQA